MAEGTTAVVANAVKGVALDGVLTELTALIPVVIPVCISFLAIRKGISFLIGTLQSA